MPAEPAAEFVATYLSVRERERRLLRDDAVRALPHVAPDDPLATEWRQRADTAERFSRYLAGLGRPVDVWDLGCGNGWFSARMARVGGVRVTGIDVNEPELEQARRVFGHQPRLEFRLGDLRQTARQGTGQPDVIVLAASLHYVADPAGLLRGLLGAVAPGGEVHVLDTMIYRPDEVAAARARSRRHYEGLGVPEMVEHYHHLSWPVFDGLPHDVRFRPRPVVARCRQLLHLSPPSPFPWIRLTTGARG